VVVHGLDSKLGAQGLGEVLSKPQKQARKDKITSITKDFVGISSENYKIVQIHKNLEGYRLNPKQAPVNTTPPAKKTSVKNPDINNKPDPIKKKALIEKLKRQKKAGDNKKETP
jgi:hypothetical protein